MASSTVYRSPYPMSQVPTDQSISQFLLTSDPDDAEPDKVVLADHDDPARSCATYAGIRQNAARDAAVLRRECSVNEGDVVCIYASNSVHWASLAHASLWAGACFCGVNPLATAFELEHYFQTAKPTIIATETGLLDNVERAMRALNIDSRVILIEKDVSGSRSSHLTYPRDFLPGTEQILPFDLSSRDNRQTHAALCFSSGTSGSPKAVVMTHYNLIAQMLSLRSVNPFLHSSKVREVFFPSFAHIYGVVSGLLVPAWVGSYVEIMGRFDFMQYLQRSAQIQATVLRLVPAVALRMVKTPEVGRLNLSSVQGVMCSGAPLSDSMAESLRRLLAPGVGVLNGYGMTEGTATLLRETRKDKGASVGRPSAGVSIRVVDDDLNDVVAGTDGECLIKGPTVFLEYKNNPVASAESRTKDGWLRTGDVVRADKEGFFYLTGRKKELIKFKGYQIAPSELEAVLLLDSRVADAGVCGVYDKTLETEIPIAFVSLKEDPGDNARTQVLAELKTFVNSRVSAYKRLHRSVLYTETLPKNASHKLLRMELTALASRDQSLLSKL